MIKKINVISVLDRRDRRLLQNIKYIEAPENHWKDCVSLLIARSRLTIFVLPPDRGPTPSIQWEMAQSVKYGYHGKTCVFLPRKEMISPEMRSLYVESLRSEFGADTKLLDAEDVFAVYIGDTSMYHFTTYGKKERIKNFVPLRPVSLREAVADVLDRAISVQINSSFYEKYPYFKASLKHIRKTMMSEHTDIN